MSEFFEIVEQICSQDKRYKPDAYEFVLEGLTFTQKKLKKPVSSDAKHSLGQAHVSGKELAYGLRDFAIDRYGALSSRVLSHWGINQTLDFGNIVFNMIEKKLLSKTPDDSRLDFDAVYDFKVAFSNILAESVIAGFKSKK